MSVEFEDNTMRVINSLNEGILNFLEEASGELEAQAIRNTTVDKSQLKGSWKHVVDRSNFSAVVGSPLENAIWEEFGTGEYALKGNGRKGAWYVPVEKATGTKKPTFNGKVVVVYGKNGQAFYKTNGKKPKRMLQRAIDTRKNLIGRTLVQKLREQMR